MNKFKRWLLPVVIVSLLLAVLVGGSCAPQSLGEVLDPSGNPFAHRFSDVKDIRTATFVVAASDSEHKYEADYQCDGTDDHIQIQAAIDALPATGGEVKLLDGTYYIEVSLVLGSYQTLRGQGRSTIPTTTTANLDIITATGGDGSEKVGILIADLCVDGNAGGAVNDMGISWTYVDYSKVYNVYSLDNGEEGIRLDYCDFNEVSDNTCQGNGLDSIFLYDSSYNSVSNNTCQGNGDSGIYLYDSDNNIVSDNTFQGNAKSGIYLAGSSYNSVSNNICQGNGDSGIYLYDSDNNIVSDNTCQGNGNDGILFAVSSYNSISDNTCQGNAECGIFLDDSSYNSVSDNTCQRNGDDGITLYGSDNNDVIGNICLENSQSEDNWHGNIYLYTSDYNLIEGNLCRAPTIGTTLTDGEPIGETEIAVADVAGFEVGMGVVIDLGGGSEEYHRIVAITGAAPGVIIIDAGLTFVQIVGEDIAVPEAEYGINIWDVSSIKNVVVGNDLYDAGKTANFYDAGTGTIVWENNRDIDPIQVKHLIYVQNTSGGNLLTGNVVKYNAAAGAVGFTTPTAVGDDGVWGMLVEDINNNAYGYIQVLGGTTLLDATNAGGAIAIGGFLCTEIGVRARLAAAGDMVFAIALEACDVADAVIDALIIVPRKI